MPQFSSSEWILYFTIYSILGWLCETIWCSVGAGKMVNRGFLSGPWCPVYGFGAVILMLFAEPLRKYFVLVFFLSVLTTTALEYFSGWLLETLFKTRWWDYSERRFQIKGRICLRNSLLFGFLGMAAVYILQPFSSHLLLHISSHTQRVLASTIVAILFIDLIRSLAVAAKLDEQLSKIKSLIQEMSQHFESYDWFDGKDIGGSIQRLRNLSVKEPDNKKAADILEKYKEQISSGRSITRLLRAFPKLTPHYFSSEVVALRNEWDTFEKHPDRFAAIKDFLTVKWGKERENIRLSYKDITVTRMVWVFLIGSNIGYIVETLFFFVTRGVVESRQGMVYGPFSQIYGFGAVIMVLLLTPFVHKGDGWLFMGGAVAGGMFETVSSLFQEICYGGVSWGYSNERFSLFGGRTSLLFMSFWGILAVIYMKRIYPRTSALIDRIPKRPKYFFTWVITICLTADMLLSVLTLNRWSQRLDGVPAKNAAEVWLDTNFSNDKLKEIYPSMRFTVK